MVKQTEIGDIIFNKRKEKNPCALCAKMRRGALNDMCREYGCNKLAWAITGTTPSRPCS